MFYAAKAMLLHLGIRSKSHKSVHTGVEVAIDRGHLSTDWTGVLNRLHARRNQAVYRYARRDWTVQEAEDALDTAGRFIAEVEGILASG